MIWIIGSGNMAAEYAKVLKELDYDFSVIGRGLESAEKFQSIINAKVITGGLKGFLEKETSIAEAAIITVGVESLAESTILLIKHGVKKILVEKPAGSTIKQIKEVNSLAEMNNAEVFVAYNRRFYASVLKAKELIAEDGGVKSFNFEFTEWAHKIKDIPKAEGVKENWFLANSTHVVDLAFFLGGTPKEITGYTAGKNAIDWHPSAAVFAGAGVSENGALFNYSANWIAPGRWSVEVLTDKHKYIFRPMEKLHIQDVGSVQINEVEGIDYDLDEKFKPGLFLQVKAFIFDDSEDSLLKLDDFVKHLGTYEKIGGLIV